MHKSPGCWIIRDKNRRAGRHSPRRAALSCLAASLIAVAMPAMALAKTQPKSATASVQIGEIGRSAKVTLVIGDTLTVLLPANVTTGYGWEIAANNQALLAPGPRTSLPPENQRLGTSGTQKLVFTAKTAGRDRLVFAYKRPWEKNAAPARSLTLEVAITPAAANFVASVVPEGKLIARYAGNLPCADCRSIRETIAFYSLGSALSTAGYYVEAMTYLDAPHGNVVNVTAGKWTSKRTGSSDASTTIYELSLDSSPRTRNYQLKGRSLIPLDTALRPIQSPYDMALRRIR